MFGCSRSDGHGAPAEKAYFATGVSIFFPKKGEKIKVNHLIHCPSIMGVSVNVLTLSGSSMLTFRPGFALSGSTHSLLGFAKIFPAEDDVSLPMIGVAAEAVEPEAEELARGAGDGRAAVGTLVTTDLTATLSVELELVAELRGGRAGLGIVGRVDGDGGGRD